MALSLKEGVDTTDLPTITLAGKAYFVPRASLRTVLALVAIAPKADAAVAKLPTLAQINEPGFIMPEFSETEFFPLVDAVRIALLPIYPTITREDLLAEDIDLDELIAARPVINKQSSSRRRPGEAEAAGPQAQPNGADSSPTSISS